MSTISLTDGEDAFHPDRESLRDNVEESIENGDTQFNVDVTVTWRDDEGEFHTEVRGIEFDAETWDEFLSMYYQELRDIIEDLVGSGHYEDAGITG